MRFLVPVLIWLVLFATAQFIPAAVRPTPTVSILPAFDAFFSSPTGTLLLAALTVPLIVVCAAPAPAVLAFVPLIAASLGQLASIQPVAFLDIFFVLPYGLLHYISPVLFSVFLAFKGPENATKTFLVAFGSQNAAGVVTQLLLPCAPPWYINKYGFAPANYTIPGDPAGLKNVDAILGTSFYSSSFSASPLVFGPMPSLHSAFAVLIFLFAQHFSPVSGIVLFFYVVWMWGATIYFRHHFMIDLIAGAAYAAVAYALSRKYLGKDCGLIQWIFPSVKSFHPLSSVDESDAHPSNHIQDLNIDSNNDIHRTLNQDTDQERFAIQINPKPIAKSNSAVPIFQAQRLYANPASSQTWDDVSLDSQPLNNRNLTKSSSSYSLSILNNPPHDPSDAFLGLRALSRTTSPNPTGNANTSYLPISNDEN